jgi:hypothetical protein
MKVYQWDNREVKPRIVDDCMAQVKANCGCDYLCLPIDHGYDIKKSDPRCESDVLRCTLLADDPTGEWIDVDTEIIKQFVPPPDGKPYFSQGLDGRANGDVIIANGNDSVFIELLVDYEAGVVPRKPGWMQQLLNRDYRRWIGLIPAGYYRHLALCHAAHLMENQVMGTPQAVIGMKNGELVVLERR